MKNLTEEKIILEIMETESGRDLSDIGAIDLNECGVVDHPDDMGGVTSIWGWTEKSLKSVGYNRTAAELTFQEAYVLYATHQYVKSGASRVFPLHPALARAMCDFAVHSGTKTAVKALQMVLNLHNNKGTLWKDLKEDGVIGPNTIKALVAYLEKRKGNTGRDVVMCDYLIRIGAHYQNIALAKESQEVFYYGWISRVNDMLEEYFSSNG
jgi:lysozyme family protein